MKLIDDALFQTLAKKAAASPRLRAHHNLHESLESEIHRLVMVIEPNSYVRPHRHTEAGKWELMTVLRGGIDILVFDDAATVIGRHSLRAGGPSHAIEIPQGTWHTVIAVEPKTLLLEVKRGPYVPLPEADVAGWAPAEGQPGAIAFYAWFERARVGDKPPVL